MVWGMVVVMVRVRVRVRVRVSVSVRVRVAPYAAMQRPRGSGLRGTREVDGRLRRRVRGRLVG